MLSTIRLLAAIAGFAWLAASAGAAEIHSCSELAGMTSGGGSEAGDVTVINDGKAGATLEWLDYEGKATTYAQIGPGEQFAQPSYDTHLWKLSSKGKCLCGFALEPGAQTVAISSKGQCTTGGDVPEAHVGKYEPTDSYSVQTVAGFTVRVSSKYSSRALKPVLAELERGLVKMKKALPPAALSKLTGVTIWLETADKLFPGGVYHADANWLRDNGMNPDKAGGVQFSATIVEWVSQQPSMVLHEFAHAYHDQVLGYGYRPVVDAYKAAKATGRYDSVAHVVGPNQKAYALNNEMEFFAELSEAYFGKNDFYPFDRSDLASFDPASEAVIADAWR